MQAFHSLDDLDVTGKTVLVRADLNVPMNGRTSQTVRGSTGLLRRLCGWQKPEPGLSFCLISDVQRVLSCQVCPLRHCNILWRRRSDEMLDLRRAVWEMWPKRL